MPESKEMMMQYEDLLDKLAEDYPELGAEVEALSDKMMGLEMGAEGEEEDLIAPDAESVPPDLMDGEEEEEEYEL